MTAMRAAPARAFHASAAPEGGRRTSLAPDRVLRWKANLSKKAKKRRRTAIRSSRERALSRPAVPLAVPERSAAELQADRDGQAMLAAMLSHARRPTLRRGEALARENPDELVMRLETGEEPASVAAWDCAIRAYGAAGRFGEAVGCVQRVRELGMVPQETTFNALIGACAAQGNVEAAMATAEAMREQGLEPTGRTYGALMHACVEGGDAARAMALLGEAGKDGVELNNVHFTTVMTGLIRAGEAERAFEVYNHMRTNHCKPDAGTYAALVTACSRLDQVEKAHRYVRDMQEDGLRPNRFVLNALAHACARSMRHHEQAHDVFGQLRGEGMAPDLYTYRAALLACTHEGDTTRARDYMRQMAEEGLEPDADTANVLLAVYSRAVDPRLAARVAHRRRGQMAHGSETEGDRAAANEGSGLLRLADEAEDDAIVGERPWWEDPKKMPERGLFEMPGDRVGLARVAQRVLAHYYDKNAQAKGGEVPLEGREAVDKLQDAERDGVDADAALSSDEHRLTQQDLLEHPEHRQWRETMLDAGMSREHLEDMEFEIINGRPDTDAEAPDPEEADLLRRRAARVREHAAGQNLERVMRGLPLSSDELRRRARNRDLKAVGATGYDGATTSDGEGTRERLTEAVAGMMGVSRAVVDGSAARALAQGLEQERLLEEQLGYERALEAVAGGRAAAVPDSQLSPRQRQAAARALVRAVGRVGADALGMSATARSALEADARSLAADPPVPAALAAGDVMGSLAAARDEIDGLSDLSDMLGGGEADRRLAEEDRERGVLGRSALGEEIRATKDGKGIRVDGAVAEMLVRAPERSHEAGFAKPRERFGLGGAGPMQRATEATARLPPGLLPGSKVDAAAVEQAAEAARVKAEMDYLLDVGAEGAEPAGDDAYGFTRAAAVAGDKAADAVRAEGTEGLERRLREAEEALAEASASAEAPAAGEGGAVADPGNELSLRALATTPIPPGHPEERVLRRLQTVARAALRQRGLDWRTDVDAAAAVTLARAPDAFIERLDRLRKEAAHSVWTTAGRGGADQGAAGDGAVGAGAIDIMGGAAAPGPAGGATAVPDGPGSDRRAPLRELLRRQTGIDLDRAPGDASTVTAFRFASAVTRLLAQGEAEADTTGLMERLRIGKRSLREFCEGADSELDPDIDLQALHSDVDDADILGAYEAREEDRTAAALLSIMPSKEAVLGRAGSARFLGARAAPHARPWTRDGDMAETVGGGLDGGGSDYGAYDDPLASDGVVAPLLARPDDTASELEHAAEAMEAGERGASPTRRRPGPSLADELRVHLQSLPPPGRDAVTAALESAGIHGSVGPLLHSDVLPLLPAGLRRAIADRFDAGDDVTVLPDGTLSFSISSTLSELAGLAGMEVALAQPQPLPSAARDAGADAARYSIPQSVASAFLEAQRAAEGDAAALRAAAGSDGEHEAMRRYRAADEAAAEAEKDPASRRAALDGLHRAQRDVLALGLEALEGAAAAPADGAGVPSARSREAATALLLDEARRADRGQAPSPLLTDRSQGGAGRGPGARSIEDSAAAALGDAAQTELGPGARAGVPKAATAADAALRAAGVGKQSRRQASAAAADAPRAAPAAPKPAAAVAAATRGRQRERTAGGRAAAAAAAAPPAPAPQAPHDDDDDADDFGAQAGDYDGDDDDGPLLEHDDTAAWAPPALPPLSGAWLYRGYDPCHVVDDRGVVWEPVAPHGAPTPPGFVRRRRSGLGIRGRTHLPRPRFLHRLEGESVREMLLLDDRAAELAREALPEDRGRILMHLQQLQRSVRDTEEAAGIGAGAGGAGHEAGDWEESAWVVAGAGGLGDADETDPIVSARYARDGAAAGRDTRADGPGAAGNRSRHDHGVGGMQSLGAPGVHPEPYGRRPRGMPRHVTPSGALAGLRDDPGLSLAEGVDDEAADAAARALAAAEAARLDAPSGGESLLARRLRERVSETRTSTTAALASRLRPNPAPAALQAMHPDEQLRRLGQEDIEDRLLAGSVGGGGSSERGTDVDDDEQSAGGGGDWDDVGGGEGDGEGALPWNDGSWEREELAGRGGEGAGRRSSEIVRRAEELLMRSRDGLVTLDDDEAAALHAVIGRHELDDADRRRNDADAAFEGYRDGLRGLADDAADRADARAIGEGLGPVERALVAATESLQQRRKRAEEGYEPSLPDVLLAVRSLQRGTVDASHLYRDRATGEWAAELFDEVAEAEGRALAASPGDLARAAAEPGAAEAVEGAAAGPGAAEEARDRARERLLLYAATGEVDRARGEAVLRGQRLPGAPVRAPAGGAGLHGAAALDSAARSGAGASLLLPGPSGLGAGDGALTALPAGHGSHASDVEALTDTEAAGEQARSLVRSLGGDEDSLSVEGAAFASSDTVARMLAVGEAAGVLSRHGKRVKRAREALARMVAPGRPGEVRLRALQRLSDRVLGGMRWFPRTLPTNPDEARASLVEEAERVYARVYSHGAAPGPGRWDGPGALGRGEDDGEAGAPTLVTLNTMVAVYCNAGMGRKAYAFVGEEFGRWGLEPDERTLRPLVRMHARQRRMDLAEEVVGLMLEAGMEPTVDSWGPLAHGYAREWRLAEAVGVMKEMRSRGLECPEHWAVLTRKRLKDLGVWHRDVPQHPIAWQYSQRSLKHRFDRTKRVRKMREYSRGYDDKARQRLSL